KQAEAQGLTLEEYQRRAETDHSIDRALDDQMRSRAAQGNAVLEGRLPPLLAGGPRPSAPPRLLRAARPAPAGARARRRGGAVRIAGREGGGTSERLREIQAREASDARRYRVIYGVDYHDPAHYDLVLHSDGRSPEELAAEIVEHARRLP